VLYIPTFSVSLHTIFSVNINQSWNRRPSRAQWRTGHWHERVFESQNWSDGGGQMKQDLKNDLQDDKSVRKRETNNKQYLHSIGSLFNFVALLGMPTSNCCAIHCRCEWDNVLIR